MKSLHMNLNRSTTAAWRKGEKVILKESWENPVRKGLHFHKGTKGEIVNGEITDGNVQVFMRFPHQPPIIAQFPLHILEKA